uniref:Uncharacterized protein n=1 Tax=Acrobeloides nanus TaxID=290746 RepID=A0A914DRY6_9BILA
MYSEINCGDGSNIAIPSINLIIAFIGIVATKQPHFPWHAFVHHVLTIIAFLFNIFAIIDLTLMAERWSSWSHHPRTSANWPHNFIVMDMVFVSVLMVNEIICGIMLFIQIVYFRNYFENCTLRRSTNLQRDNISERDQIVPA